MARNPITLARTLPRLAPDLSRVPTGRMLDLGDGVVTRVYDTGEDHLQPVVLLHGMVATGMLNWYQTFQRLIGEYRLITYDQRWHGRGHRGNFSFDTLTDDVLRLADRLELPAPILGGYSMGGIVSQLAARRDPSRLGGLVLAATGTGAERNAMEKVTMNSFFRSGPVLDAVPGAVTADDVQPYRHIHRWALKELSSVSMATNRNVISQVARFNSVPWLEELDLPVAIIKTTRDVAFPQKVQDEMADLLPCSAVFPIEAGHAVCATHPGRFARRMRTGIGWVVSNMH